MRGGEIQKRSICISKTERKQTMKKRAPTLPPTIIDRGLSMISMIVGGTVGALFFIVCFLSVYRYKSIFVSLLPHGRLNEWKELGKNGQRGFEYGEFWLARASFSPFLCSILCRRVIAYLLSSSSKKKSTTTHGGKSIFWERIPAFHFLKRDLSTWHRRLGEFCID